MALHRIYFVFNDKDYSLQNWPQVPRVGDRVLLYPKGKPTAFVVTDVLWNVIPEPRMDEFAVNVKIKKEEASNDQ